MSSGLRFAILGPLEVEGPDGPLAVSPGKQREILALLLLNAGEVVARDRLVDALWGEAPPPNAVISSRPASAPDDTEESGAWGTCRSSSPRSSSRRRD